MLAAYCSGENCLEQVKEYMYGNVEIHSLFLLEKIPSVKLIEPEGTYLVWLDFRKLYLVTG